MRIPCPKAPRASAQGHGATAQGPYGIPLNGRVSRLARASGFAVRLEGQRQRRSRGEARGRIPRRRGLASSRPRVCAAIRMPGKCNLARIQCCLGAVNPGIGRTKNLWGGGAPVQAVDPDRAARDARSARVLANARETERVAR